MADNMGMSTAEIEAGFRTEPLEETCPSGNIFETVKEKAKDVASSASDLMSGAKEKVKEKVHEWAGDAADAAGVVKEKTQEFATAAVHKAENFGEGLTNLMRRYPIPTLLIGFGIGILAARMMRRD
jgi:gas vesicle protein